MKELEKVEHELDPIYDTKSKILILGSIPSPKSREYGFYYAHPQNRFWYILSNLFNTKIPNDKNLKKQFLLDNNIALWDVIASCNIIGASDESIKDVKVNDINLILKHANIKKIFTTGKKAYKLYMKYCYSNTNVEAIYLPSTSAANATISLEKIIEEYRIILKYLN